MEMRRDYLRPFRGKKSLRPSTTILIHEMALKLIKWSRTLVRQGPEGRQITSRETNSTSRARIWGTWKIRQPETLQKGLSEF